MLIIHFSGISEYLRSGDLPWESGFLIKLLFDGSWIPGIAGLQLWRVLIMSEAGLLGSDGTKRVACGEKLVQFTPPLMLEVGLYKQPKEEDGAEDIWTKKTIPKVSVGLSTGIVMALRLISPKFS